MPLSAGAQAVKRSKNSRHHDVTEEILRVNTP